MTTDWEQQHRLYLARLEQRVKSIYEAAAKEAAAIGVSIDPASLFPLTDELFTFDQFPITHERIDRLMADLHNQLHTAIVSGIDSQWTLANNKNNELCRQVFADRLDSLTLEQQRRYFRSNEAARDAFKQRQQQGLGLSDRVWHYTDLYRHEIELSLDLGIRSGQSAAEMARDMQQYLQQPDKLFRRVRDQHGNLVLSQAARAYHPGQGVYRSSFMNARRLAVTETNMAYRTADHLRVQQLDFVVGIEVHLSNNHNCKGVKKGEFYDICDELQGRYPKDFKFTGWHPHCRCHTTTILKSPEEFQQDQERIARGEQPQEASENQITDVPDNFKQWLQDNSQRIERAAQRGTLPYFLRDNGTATPQGLYTLNPFHQPAQPAPISPLEIAARRHAARTPEDIARLEAQRDAWRQRNLANQTELNKARNLAEAVRNHWHELDTSQLQTLLDGTHGGLVLRGDTLQRLQQERQTLLAAIKAQRAAEQQLSDLIPDIHQWHQQFTLADLQQAHAAVKAKLAGWSNLPLSVIEQKLQYEIGWVEQHKKYPTWGVAKSAYQKELAAVQHKIKWQPIDNDIAALKAFNTKDKEFNKLLTAIDKARPDEAFEGLIKHLIKEAQNKQAQLLQEQLLQAQAKKAGNPFTPDAYSQARKNAAVWCNTDKEEIAYLKKQNADVWKNASPETYQAMRDYTYKSGYYTKTARSLPGYLETDKAYADKAVKHINLLTDRIAKSTMTADVWLRREERAAFTALKAGGIDLLKIRDEIDNYEKKVRQKYAGKLSSKDIDKKIQDYSQWRAKKLIGLTGEDPSTLSTSANMTYQFVGTGGDNLFGDPLVTLNIYCPKGTQMAYVAPHSSCGPGEHEVLLQGFSKFRITDAKYDSINDKWIVDCEIIGQNPRHAKGVSWDPVEKGWKIEWL